MNRKSSFKESIAYFAVKGFGCFVRGLPVAWALWIGRQLGTLAYYLDGRHRNIVYVNLKMAFAGSKSLREIRHLTRQVFQNYGQNIIELLRLPSMNADLSSRYLHVEGRDHIARALEKGRGVILLAMHYGSWELANLVSAMMGHPYKVIVKPQTRYSRLDQLLNSYRECGGTVTIQKGIATRDLIRSLKKNEIVAMVMDQGGRDGVRVPFFKRQASMSDGAIRIGMKMDVPICFAVIMREKGPHHRIAIHEPLVLEKTGDLEADIRTNIAKMAKVMEDTITRNPSEYMWFYKIWKYTRDIEVVILNDGRTGHLRQSQAVSRLLNESLAQRGFTAHVRVCDVVFRNALSAQAASLVTAVSRRFPIPRRIGFLRFLLTPGSYGDLMSFKADYIVSCGSRTAYLNCLLAEDQQAKSIAIQKPGMLGLNRFDLVVLPEHDLPAGNKTPQGVAVTHGAPNLITPGYLEDHSRLLLNRFSHLKFKGGIRIGLLIGGDTKDLALSEKRLKIVVHQITEVAEEIDAGILVTTSRRTSENVENMLMRELKRHPRCQLLILANRQNVPEAMGGILGLSDIVIVSGDSISMISEAASSGKKTVVFKHDKRFFQRVMRKHDQFINRLNARGYILSSDVEHLKRAVYNLAKNKIQTRTLDDHETIRKFLEALI